MRTMCRGSRLAIATREEEPVDETLVESSRTAGGARWGGACKPWSGSHSRPRSGEQAEREVVGTKGTLSSVEWTGGDWALLPADQFRDFKPPHASLPRAPEQSHHQEWLRACRGGPPAFCRFDGFAARLTETMLVANLALRTGKNLRWDAETMAATGWPEAAPFIKRDYRTGW